MVRARVNKIIKCWVSLLVVFADLAGMGRILYALLEHSFYIREPEEGADDAAGMKRGVMAFRPLVAPIKCAVLPLSSQSSFTPTCTRAMDALGARHIR